MGTDPKQFFTDAFRRLTGRAPYPWQQTLFLEIVAGHWPQVVNLPTGAGKTAVLQIWLLALAWSLHAGTSSVPRRLAWIVNRRVVVDQVTDEAATLIGGNCALDRCPEIRDLLRGASLTGKALAVSTLRGQRADNGDWARDPSTPAVVIGTVDMIGSRLLFRGYRSGRYHRPMHAGLLGVDTLIVNDEAHLSPAFAWLLEQIYALRPAARVPNKCFRVLLLSATPGESGLKVFAHSPAQDAAQSDAFRQVYEAPKKLTMHEVESKSVESTLWQLATENPAARTLVFIEQPEKAVTFAGRLAKDGRNVALLTGTMRGLERDELAQSDPMFKKFLEREPPSKPVWLVSTSAGEVGVNLSCERLVTGLVEADHLLQRFGRLNRFGLGDGESHLVYALPKKEKLLRTLEYLRTLRGNISCRSIWENKPPEGARSETPACARLEMRLIEIWAQTTYRDKFVPKVAPWLHGKQDGDAPEAELAWRADIGILTEWRIDNEQIEEVLERYPVRPHERLREPAQRILEKLRDLGTKLEEEAANRLLIQVDPDGTAQTISVAALVRSNDIANKLLLLPEKLGNISRGMFRAEPATGEARFDVADRDFYRCRYHVQNNVWSRVGQQEESMTRGGDRASLSLFAKENGLRAPLVIRHPEEEGTLLAYFADAARKRGELRDVPLPEHQSAVREKARKLADHIGLGGLADMFSKAGAIHDEGKCHDVWQRAMGGTMEAPIAKSKAPANTRLMDGYRHELGSLVKAAAENDDLLLHLIASHHAGARPFFEERQFDRETLKKSAEAALESARRYARLQHELGPWGLAYLEAVFKSADGLVSSEEGGAVSE